MARAPSRPSRRGVDRNTGNEAHARRGNRRPSRRGVDRNPRRSEFGIVALAAPLSQGRGSKHAADDDRHAVARGRPSRRGVDRNNEQPTEAGREARRPSRRGVDRNCWRWTGPAPARPSPLSQGRGSKPYPITAFQSQVESPLSQGRGSKQVGQSRLGAGEIVTLLRGCGLKRPRAARGDGRDAGRPIPCGRGSKWRAGDVLPFGVATPIAQELDRGTAPNNETDRFSSV